MKEVNGIPVYEEEDMCALDEYSKQLEEALTPKFQNIEDNLIESAEKILELEKESNDQKDTTDLLKLQVEELKNENTQLKNQIPTGTEEGESIYLSDSSDLEAKIILKGNSKQETSQTGKNLIFPLNNIITKSGITFESSNGIIHVFGTSTASIDIDIPINQIQINGDYYFSTKITGTVSANNCSIRLFNKEKDNFIDKWYTFSTNTQRGFSGQMSGTTGYIHIYVNNNVTVDFYLYPQLESGLIMTEYEPFIPNMPSSEYTSNVETVGSNFNEFDKESISENKAINGYYSNPSYGQLVDSSLSNTTDYMPIQKGKSYIFHFDYDTLGSSNNRAYCFYNEQKEVISSVKDTLYNLSNKELKFTATQNGFVRITYDKNCKDIKFEQGIKATPYSKYGQGNVEIEIKNKNSFDLSLWQDAGVSGTGSTKQINLDNNSIQINSGTSNDNYTLTGMTTTGNIVSENYRKYLFEIRPNTTYIFSFDLKGNNQDNSTNAYYSLIDSNYKSIKYVAISEKSQVDRNIVKIETNSDTKYLAIRLGVVGANNYNLYSNIQLEESPNETKYIKPQSQSKILPIQEEMLEDDYIDEEKEYHTWIKIEIDNNTTMYNDATGTSGKNRYTVNLKTLTGLDIKKSDLTDNVIAYSNMFKLLSAGKTWECIQGFTINNNTLYIYDEGEDISVFKEKLLNNKLIIYAKLEEPKSLPLTEEQKNILDKKTYTYKNITNINTNSIAILDVTYKKDLEILFNQVNQALVERS